MPTLLEERKINIEWADIEGRMPKTKLADTSVRAEGKHLSGVIRHALVAAKLLTIYEVEEEFMPLRMAWGMACEDWSVGLYPDLIWQPGERTKDQVSGNCDGIGPLELPDESEVYGIEEFKATWKSRHKYGDVVNQALWMWQLAGYCVMYGYTHARLHIFWVNGDYRPPAPDYRTYLIEFTQAELDKFWRNVVLVNRDDVKAEEKRK